MRTHSSTYLHEKTREQLQRLKEKTGVESSSLLIRAAVAVLSELNKPLLNEWVDEVRQWKNGK